MSEMESHEPDQGGGPLDEVGDALSTAATVAAHVIDDLPYAAHGIHDGRAGVVDGHLGGETPEHLRAYATGWIEGKHEADELARPDLSLPRQTSMGPNTMTPEQEREGHEIDEAHKELRRVLNGEGEGPEPHTDPEIPWWAEPQAPEAD
jgi:hypothetical protein